MTTSEVKQRVLAESAELETRIKNLTAFISSGPAFEALSPMQRALLAAQLHPMREYAALLKRRLSDPTFT